MFVLDYRGPFNLAARSQCRRIIERGADRLAVENHVTLALDHVPIIAFPGARWNSPRIARPMPGDHAQRGHTEAHEGRGEFLRSDAVFAQMRLMKIGIDLVECRPDVI